MMIVVSFPTIYLRIIICNSFEDYISHQLRRRCIFHHLFKTWVTSHVIFLSNDDDNKSLSWVLDDDASIGVNISAIDLLVRLAIWYAYTSKVWQTWEVNIILYERIIPMCIIYHLVIVYRVSHWLRFWASLQSGQFLIRAGYFIWSHLQMMSRGVFFLVLTILLVSIIVFLFRVIFSH